MKNETKPQDFFLLLFTKLVEYNLQRLYKMVHRQCDLTIMENTWQGKAVDLVAEIMRMLLREKSGLLLCKVGNLHPWSGCPGVLKMSAGREGKRL